MTNIYQPARPTNAGYMPANNVYVPTTSTWNSDCKVDCSYMRTKFGILKLLQQIFIVIAPISHFCSLLYMAHSPDSQTQAYYKNHASSTAFIFMCSILFYTVLLFIWLPVVHVLMWAYLLHKVEKFTNYPWYAIEFTVCAGGALMCLIASITPIYRFFVELTLGTFIVSVLTLFAAFIFIFNIGLLCTKKKMNVVLQGPTGI